MHQTDFNLHYISKCTGESMHQTDSSVLLMVCCHGSHQSPQRSLRQSESFAFCRVSCVSEYHVSRASILRSGIRRESVFSHSSQCGVYTIVVE